MHCKLIFTAIVHIFNAYEFMFTARKYNFSRCKDTYFCRFYQIKLL